MFARYEISSVYRHGQGLRACQIAAGSIIKQASYEALTCIANKAWFYRLLQRVAFLIFTERPAIGAKRCGLERNSVEQNGRFLRSFSFELLDLEVALTGENVNFDRAYSETSEREYLLFYTRSFLCCVHLSVLISGCKLKVTF